MHAFNFLSSYGSFWIDLDELDNGDVCSEYGIKPELKREMQGSLWFGSAQTQAKQEFSI